MKQKFKTKTFALTESADSISVDVDDKELTGKEAFAIIITLIDMLLEGTPEKSLNEILTDIAYFYKQQP